MAQETAYRGAAISTELAQKLATYLGFRHFYRHSYSFFLEWDKLQELVTSLRAIWAQTKEELHEFLDTFSTEDEL